ncbi:MAG TPA: hypothetical protein DEQ09_11500 [Bacteroidales bacterium]|nr:hypothetical protein [Bacteroidales bacterium]
MKARDIVIFLIIVFIIYSSANIYIYFKGEFAFGDLIGNSLYTILFILLSFSFVAGKILEHNYSSLTSDILNIIGGFWLSFIFYSVIILIAADLLRFLFVLINIIPPDNINAVKQASYLVSFGLALLLIISGFTNTEFPVVRKYEVVLNKPSHIKEITIAAVSDIHLGSIIRKRSMRILSGKLESISPDMVLLLGDIVDGEINPVLRNDLLQSLTFPSTASHVYAITGNHEYIGNYQKTIPYIENKGIRILLDEVVEVYEGIQLAGRKDRDSFRYTGKRRKDLDDLLKEADKEKPVIIMDHQPPLKKENNLSGFDIMLSGHTHNGQMWPLNYLTSSIYRLQYGHKVIDGCHYIVSSGFGSWGPRVRLGSRSEILEMSWM